MRYSVGIQFNLKLNPENTPLPVPTSTITRTLFAEDYTLHSGLPLYRRTRITKPFYYWELNDN